MRVHNKNNAENKMVSAFCGVQNKDDKAIPCPPQKKYDKPSKDND